MNDTFSSDAWRKLSQMKSKKEENCFSNLARKMIQVTDEDPDVDMVKKSR